MGVGGIENKQVGILDKIQVWIILVVSFFSMLTVGGVDYAFAVCIDPVSVRISWMFLLKERDLCIPNFDKSPGVCSSKEISAAKVSKPIGKKGSVIWRRRKDSKP